MSWQILATAGGLLVLLIAEIVTGQILGHRDGYQLGYRAGDRDGYRRGLEEGRLLQSRDAARDAQARHAQPESDAAWDGNRPLFDPPHEADATAVLPRLADATVILDLPPIPVPAAPRQHRRSS
jgi:hypothetical protein